MKIRPSKFNRGFTLVESIIAMGIFVIIATGIYFSYSNILDIFSASYLNLTALSVLESEFELVRNMLYSDVGTVGGAPVGVIPQQKNVTYSNIQFVVETSVRNVDDPFDGLQGGNPNDLDPADYKLVEIEVTCPTCPRYIPAKATTTIAPVGLESVSNKGTLVIKVLNASGQPVSSANVSVVNNNVSPAININDITDITGTLSLIDVPPNNGGYAISVTRAGYSSDRTYPIGGVGNPNPLKPNATVIQDQVTQISFAIDLTSTIVLRTQNNFCAGVQSVDYNLNGQKLIGTNPNTLKYTSTGVTNSSGDKIISGLEYDGYTFVNQDVSYEVSGFTPPTPLAVDPNGNYNVTWLMEAKTPSAIVVSVKDSVGNMIDDAKVTLSRQSYSEEKYSGRKSFIDTDWSSDQYDSKSTYLSTSVTGELGLGLIGGKYASMSDEWLISQTTDFGTTNTTFYNLNFSSSQPAQTNLKIQLASNNDNNTWNFLGPDGTSGTYYTSSNTQISSAHNGNRYFRYKVILRTENQDNTPKLDDLTVNFHSSCIPSGQVYFSGLSQNTYTVKVEKSGYQTFTDNGVVINSNWKDYRVNLNP